MTIRSKPPRPFIYNPPQNTELNILHKEEDFLVLSKPSGLLTVAGKSAAHADCLESRVHVLYPKARIVHRLDMDTSGVMVLALNAKAHRNLGLQFERRKVKKIYIAHVWGHMKDSSGEINLPLICDWPNRPKQMVDYGRGRASLTYWEVLAHGETASGEPVTRVQLFPHTGRSHQLRIHMLSLGYPILGDNLYAHEQALKASTRLQLHAQELSFHRPCDGEIQKFFEPCPFYMTLAI